MRVCVDVPGLAQNDVETTVKDGTLSISGTWPESQEATSGHTVHLHERPTGPFTRRVALPVPVDEGKVTATLKKGVLEITLPIAESAETRRIKIKSA